MFTFSGQFIRTWFLFSSLLLTRIQLKKVQSYPIPVGFFLANQNFTLCVGLSWPARRASACMNCRFVYQKVTYDQFIPAPRLARLFVRLCSTVDCLNFSFCHIWEKRTMWLNYNKLTLSPCTYAQFMPLDDHTSYLSFFVRHHIYWPLNCTPEKCVNLWQNSVNQYWAYWCFGWCSWCFIVGMVYLLDEVEHLVFWVVYLVFISQKLRGFVFIFF